MSKLRRKKTYSFSEARVLTMTAGVISSNEPASKVK